MMSSVYNTVTLVLKGTLALGPDRKPEKLVDVTFSGLL